MKKNLFLLLTLFCVSAYAVDNSSAIVYSADSMSAELKIGPSYFDGEEHFFSFVLPQNENVKVTRINNTYLIGGTNKVISLYENDTEDIVRENEKFKKGVFVDTLINANAFTFVIDNITSEYAYQPKDPAITIRFSVIDEHSSSESVLFNGDVEVVSGALTTSGYQDFMGAKVTAILGDAFNEYTCFGSARGGMIRGSDAGYLILGGNPNGYGNRNVYINRYTSNGDVIMTAGSGQVGIGVDDPKEKLHVNGAIRGGGANGEVTLKGDSGYVTIGASSHAMEMVTNKEKFLFNKPIVTSSGTYNVQDSDLALKLNDTTRVTILQNNGNVGIGTSSPTAKLHVNDGAIMITNESSQSDRPNNVILFGDDSNVKIGEWEKNNYLSFLANGYNFTNGNVGIGTSTPAYTLDVAGTIRAEEIIVETDGADFVFEDGYNLRPLSEVESFLLDNKHLPEIKSAQEMQTNGISVSEMQTQLLQKIEELTLYIIQQEKRIQTLEKELNK